MKSTFLARMFLAGVIAAILAACATRPATVGAPALVGTWTNSLGTVWTIKPDGTFDVYLKHHRQRDAWGAYSAERDTVTFVRLGGINPKGCDGKGVYTFSRPNENSLRFTLVSDECKLRKKNVLLPWRRK